MTFEEATSQIAKKYGLGSTLVTGHMAKYWTEAAELYARSKFDEGVSKVRIRVTGYDGKYSDRNIYAPKY